MLFWCELFLYDLFHPPDTAGTHAGAYAAADAEMVIGDIFKSGFRLLPPDRSFRAGFQAHAAVAAAAA